MKVAPCSPLSDTLALIAKSKANKKIPVLEKID